MQVLDHSNQFSKMLDKPFLEKMLNPDSYHKKNTNTIVKDEVFVLICSRIEDLLNTRAVSDPKLTPKNILSYGLSDFSHIHLSNEDQKWQLAKSIEEQIKTYIPEIAHVKVFVEEQGKFNAASLYIEAKLKKFDKRKFELKANINPRSRAMRVDEVAISE